MKEYFINYFFIMTWKNSICRAVRKEMQPMRQITHWILFLAVGLTYALKTLEASAAASYNLILANPDIASGSWLINAWIL